MKKWMFIFVVLLVTVGVAYTFFHKSYISFELVGELPNGSEDFRPLGYEFFHSTQELESYFRRNKRTKQLEKNLSDITFDFTNYSYCIFYGRQVASMSYSYKTTYFDDPTPTYTRPKRKIPVFVTYGEGPGSEKGTFLYRVSKDDRLRGFYD